MKEPNKNLRDFRGNNKLRSEYTQVSVQQTLEKIFLNKESINLDWDSIPVFRFRHKGPVLYVKKDNQ